ncbi:DUF4148 domain-containing protein [Paraburkholderia flagellata]|uniref:DUF4148 domain-containing protein n=1 Tax=Paraburkholderia flagellata TaxID=2883241 RepID=UPI001F48F4B8|nr:DUF4148 domain-containing protein [Paraburkholderia flagellata]
MHSRIFIVAVATAVALPVAAHAQSDASSVTREQVRQELVQLERAGYQPARVDNAHYPDDLLAANARIRAAAGADPYAVNAMGGAVNDRSASGRRVSVNASQRALYAHH